MNIRSMTATFGRLENGILSPEKGFQEICAPNGWGKTTWCAFFRSMLYGLDEEGMRYLPWSGSPMGGKIECTWQGREITVERSFTDGSFRAFFPETGEAVPELTAQNCGQVLLGLDKQSYDRALSLENTALSGPGEEMRLRKGLTEGLDRCRREGALLQQQAETWQKSREDRAGLEKQAVQLENRLYEAESFQRRLEGALDGDRREEDARERRRARKSCEKAAHEEARLREFTKTLPTRQEAQQRLRDVKSYLAAERAQQTAEENLTPQPMEPACLDAFYGLEPRQAQEKAEQDAARCRDDNRGPLWLIFLMAGLLALLGGCIGAFPMRNLPLGLAIMGLGLLMLAGAVLLSGGSKEGQSELAAAYGTPDWRLWPELAQGYAEERLRYLEDMDRWQTRKNAVSARREELDAQRQRFCEGREPEEMEELCTQVLQSWDALDAAESQLQNAREYLGSLGPEEPADSLNLSGEEARDCLQKTEEDVRQLQMDLENIRATLSGLDDLETLDDNLRKAQERLDALAQYEQAFAISMEALGETESRAGQLIAKWADVYASAVFGGDKEDPRNPSRGSRDIFGLSQSLAAFKVLSPQAPLFLDDVLSQVDEERKKRAVALLKLIGQERQVVLFCCR